MSYYRSVVSCLLILQILCLPVLAQGGKVPLSLSQDAVFDDKVLLDGYYEKFKNESKEVIIAMINDDSQGAYKMAAAVRVLKNKYADEIVSNEKNFTEKFLIRRLNKTDSPFVQVEIFHALVVLDRYAYYKVMVPKLIQKMDHYNRTVSQLAYSALQDIIKAGNDRAREARIVLGMIRKILFLSRKRLERITEPDAKLKQKLTLLRWSIKILGTQELKQLPPEVLKLLY